MQAARKQIMERNAGPPLTLQNVTKRYGDTVAVNDVSFSAPGGAFLSVVGPSGSGKTTILRLIAGFEKLDSGIVEISSNDVTDVPPHLRDIGVVFQNYALFPHMTIAENIAFPLRQRGFGRNERDRAVREMLEIVGLPDRGDDYPRQLSGGEQQRVALGRALVYRPRILLMDEPLSALDRRLRERMQEEIRSIQQHFGVTTIYVTHDQSEAFMMSDFIAVMNGGQVEQFGAPRDLYERPESIFVATFLGDSNILSGEYMSTEAGMCRIRLDECSVIACPAPRGAGSGRLTILIRPESIGLDRKDVHPAKDNILEGDIIRATYAGGTLKYAVAVGQYHLTVHTLHRTGRGFAVPGTRVRLSWPIAETTLI